MKRILFSIIVPIYKVEDCLVRCLDSLIGQTYPDIEIILVDDGSPDNCPKICDDYQKLDERVRVIHKENGGLSDARNAGLKIAQGEYIIFVDSDDYIRKDACERLIGYANGKTDMLLSDAIMPIQKKIICHGKELLGVKLSGQDYLEKEFDISGNISMIAWLNIYRKDFLLENNLFFKKGILHEDEEFTPRCFLKANEVVYTGVKFYCYIIRENSITKAKDKIKNAKDLIATCRDLERIFIDIESKNLQKQLRDTIVVKYLNAFYIGAMYRFKKEYLYKKFVLRNSFHLKTKLKALLFCFSPKLYCKINACSKRV